MALALLVVAAPASSEAAVEVTSIAVQAHPGVPDLKCPPTPAKKKAKGATRASSPLVQARDSEGIPADLEGALGDDLHPGASAPADGSALGRARAGEPYRVAIWGDSHVAAAIFTDELARLLRLAPGQVRTGYVPANMNRPGVRTPLRKTCASPQWRHEAAHFAVEGAAAPGPGLVNMYSDQAGSWLAWDVRSGSGQPQLHDLRILFERTSEPTVLAIGVDGGLEVEVALAGAAGPAALELVADAPMSIVRVRLVKGKLRFHGLALPDAPETALRMDVFGFPGATVAGWKQARLDYLASWFDEVRYDLVVLEFGTNEGNARPFDAVGYERSLVQSVGNLRALFPDASCVLVGPGDRGVLVAKDTLRYSRIHSRINRIQEAVAGRYGCKTWSMLDAMGGAGSSYRWARRTPALMARDLIHFTPAGYRQLAGQFAADLGWRREHLLAPAQLASSER